MAPTGGRSPAFALEDRSRTYDLGTALAVIRRRLPLIAALTLAGALVALAISLSQDDVYTAETTMLSRDQGLDDRISDDLLLKLQTDDSLGAATDASLAELEEVATTAGEELGMTPAEVGDAVSVTTDPETSLITVEADAGTPERAAELANTYAKSFILLRQEDDLRAASEARAGLQAAYERARGNGEPRNVLETIQQQIRQVEIYGALQTGNVEQVETAVAPNSRSAPRTVINVVAGGLAGLLIGLGTALLGDRIRPRLRSRHDAESTLGAPVLAVVPRVGKRGREDALRTLRSRLLHRGADTAPRTVLVIGAGDDAEAAAIGTGLAEVTAHSGVRSAVVDTDMSRGSVAGSGPDLAAVLAGRARPSEALDAGTDGAPTRLAPGASGDPASLLAGPHLPALMDELRSQHELTVITARSPARAPDALPLIDAADAIVVVAEIDGRRSDATTLREHLDALGAGPTGLVLVGRDAAE